MRNLIEFLENTCKIKGGDIAVSDRDGSLTFNEIRSEALRIAGGIAKRGDMGETVAVLLPKGVKSVCAMLGVLYSGGVYVPMDCRAPENRTRLILDIVKPALVIDGDNYDDIAKGEMNERLAEAAIESARDVDPAYILFTSGSTGVPKGVVIPHRRVINYINWAKERFAITGDDVIGNQAPFYFTVSAMDVYLCMATGARLEIIPEHLFSQPKRLLRHLQDKAVTLIFWVSSVYRHVMQSGALEEIKPDALKHAWFVGEPMAADTLNYWTEKLPPVRFANMYGATETDMTICFDVLKETSFEGHVPIGIPCANTGILLIKDLDADAKPAGMGEIGEICVRGSCLALGYYKDMEKTKAAFIQNPLNNSYPDMIYRTGDLAEFKDGLFIFHGRRDHQFKHLGYRIEAGEIEAVSEQAGGVRSACVLYDAEKRRIVLFYEPGGDVDEQALRRALAGNLPAYMVPTLYVRLDEMPLNANKKKDRMLLKKKYMEGDE